MYNIKRTKLNAGENLIPKQYRLKKKSDFQKLFKLGRSYAGPYFVIYFKENEVKGQTRIGFAVSKKIGTAVMRNKIKRRLREAVRPLIPQIKENYHIIIVARSRIRTAAFSELQKQLFNIFNKNRLVSGDKG